MDQRRLDRSHHPPLAIPRDARLRRPHRRQLSMAARARCRATDRHEPGIPLTPPRTPLTTPPATVGMALEEVDTPALLIDLDAFDENLARMASAAAAGGLHLRPHAKTHKCAEIALRQMARGAVGVCCQKVGEAEALVAGGVTDILVS